MRPSLTRNLLIAALAPILATFVAPVGSRADTPPEEWKAPARAARRKNPTAPDERSLAAGKAVYAAQCMSCHGPAGKGDGPAAKDLNPKPRNLSDPKIQEQTDGSIFWKITEGRKPMPTFDKLISEDDRWHVINYVRTLKSKEGK